MKFIRKFVEPFVCKELLEELIAVRKDLNQALHSEHKSQLDRDDYKEALKNQYREFNDLHQEMARKTDHYHNRIVELEKDKDKLKEKVYALDRGKHLLLRKHEELRAAIEMQEKKFRKALHGKNEEIKRLMGPTAPHLKIEGRHEKI